MLDILKNEKSEFYNLDWFKKANNSAERLSLLDLNSIIKKTIYLDYRHVKELLNLFSKTYGNLFHGIGLELGAGVGFLSSMISQIPDVEKIYSIEIVENYVKLLQPKIIKSIGVEEKVIPTLGSIENLKYFEDNSVDFIIE